jgi:ectoine hydroxylase-related dioxygenase (phytanoyl-CoA dioxygenase family)
MVNDMAVGLTPEQVSAFGHEGVVAPLELLSNDEVIRYRAAVEELVSERGQFERIDGMHAELDWARELCSHPRLLDYVASLIGDDLLVHGTLMFRKLPGRPGVVPWHQDSVYSGWHLTPTASAWIALSPSTEQNGCMQVIVGSHLQGVREHEERPGSSVLLRRGETIVEAVDESRARALVLAAGQCSLHHCNVIHGSQPNVGDEPRIGFIVRFVTSAYRPELHGRDASILLRVRGG